MTVLVIGAGIIGTAVAEALAVRGADVTVLEMRSPGQGASQASAGILAPYIEADHETPLLALATRSLAMYDAFVERVAAAIDDRIEYARSGTLEVAFDDMDVARLRALHARLAIEGVASEWLAGAVLASFEPALSPAAAGGLYTPIHGFVDARALLAALVQSAKHAGAIFESPVEALLVDSQRDGVVARAGDREYTADAAVVAAGSWSRRVRIANVAALPVRPVRGQLLHLEWTAPVAPRRVVWGPRCYTVPRGDGSLLVGATSEHVGFDESSTVAGVGGLTAAVAELLPSAGQARLETVRVGLRPALPDGLPAIGPLSRAPRITMATGHYRNGVLLAPLTAEIVARSVLDGVRDPAFDVTSPDRFVGAPGEVG